MRCRVGDPVMVLKSVFGNEGRVGQVDRWVHVGEIVKLDGIAVVSGWWVSGCFQGSCGLEDGGLFPDEWLKPLRDGPGTDETLAWKSVPLPEIAPELLPAEREDV